VPISITQHIIATQKGDKQAFNKLVVEWYPRIYNFAYKFFTTKTYPTDTHAVAMDICQKTFIAVHRNVHKLKEVDKFKPWLYRIATNYCIEEDRKRVRNNIVSFTELNEQQPYHLTKEKTAYDNPEQLERNADMKYWLLKALSQIPEEQRLVIIMKEFEGFKFREIADTLSLSENTIKSRMYYGLDAMRKIFKMWKIDKESILHE